MVLICVTRNQKINISLMLMIGESQANQYTVMVGKKLNEQHLFEEEGYGVASTTKGS